MTLGMMTFGKAGLALAALAGMVLAAGGSAQAGGNELLINGDFSAGNTGFSSAYTQSTNLYPEGDYDVISNPQADHNLFASFGDHTTGTGLMMVINGAPTPGVVAWTETVGVTAGTNYDFSAWVASVYPTSPADLEFSINGTPLGTFTASSTAGDWQEFTKTWNSGAATTADVQIIDLNTVRSGNDFALDDLSLKGQAPVPEASTTVSFGLLLALGMGGMVVAAKRKKAQSAL